MVDFFGGYLYGPAYGPAQIVERIRKKGTSMVMLVEFFKIMVEF